MDKLINVQLVKDPYNWIIVTLMCLTAAMAIKFIFVSSGTHQNLSA